MVQAPDSVWGPAPGVGWACSLLTISQREMLPREMRV